MEQWMKKIFEETISRQPLFSEERQNVKQVIQDLIRCSSPIGGPDEESERPLDLFSVQLIRWPYEQPAKRRNIVHHFLELHYDTPWHYLFKCPFSSSDETLLGNAQFATLVKRPGPWPTASIGATRKTFTGLVKELLPFANDSHILSSLEPKEPSLNQIWNETLSDYDQGFYHNASPWELVQDFVVNEHWDPRYGPPALAIFYLTNKFTEEQADSLESAIMLELGGEVLRVSCTTKSTTPLTRTLHDMWNIFWQIHKIWQIEFPRSDVPLFFADEQSFIDETLIMVDWWHLKEMNNLHYQDILKRVDKPWIRGMVYGRILAFDAISAHGSLSMEDEPVLSYFRNEVEGHDRVDVVYRYLRPDSPGHEIIPHEEL
ncbi:uncharacterized protein N7483_005166 [Penicillium malachiteum]|uniref:uncharacterized protein n=1 Tax=Penicillium malachiteum TaxID=1324776 RepID=UPI0025467DBD|nr:uncharacterized protein N7483_005166 [Penicillium malachiteum]KAJ5730658.1 hypothetical protein N7483_005166 [Penicillium malachiteum]